PCSIKKRLREGASSFSLAAAEELAARSTSSPSLMLATRTWQARSGGRKPSTNPARAPVSPVFAIRGCNSPSAERNRPSLGSRTGTAFREGVSADYPDLRPPGQGEVVEHFEAPPAGARAVHDFPGLRRQHRAVLAHPALR